MLIQQAHFRVMSFRYPTNGPIHAKNRVSKAGDWIPEEMVFNETILVPITYHNTDFVLLD